MSGPWPGGDGTASLQSEDRRHRLGFDGWIDMWQIEGIWMTVRKGPQTCRRPWAEKGRFGGRGEMVMPGGDGTGPLGEGPATGRGLGPCRGYSVPVYGARGFGRGGRWGRGLRFWRGDRIAAAAPPNESSYDEELKIDRLVATVQALEDELRDLKAKIESLHARE